MTKYERNGRAIKTVETGHTEVFKSINEAKRQSRKLGGAGIVANVTPRPQLDFRGLQPNRGHGRQELRQLNQCKADMEVA